MTLPKMMPMPTPAPAEPRPPPTPRAMALPALAVSPLAAARWVMTARSITGSPCGSVRLGDRAAEVDGSEGGEDERLQAGDQADLEDEEGHAERDGDPAQRGDPEQDGERAAHEEDDQMARQD